MLFDRPLFFANIAYGLARCVKSAARALIRKERQGRRRCQSANVRAPQERHRLQTRVRINMKRSALQCIVGFVGATLIVVGVIWTCRQLSTPSQLKAAQDVGANYKSSGVQPAPLPGVKRTQTKVTNAPQPTLKSRKIRPVAGETQINLSLVSPEDETSASTDEDALKLTEVDANATESDASENSLEDFTPPQAIASDLDPIDELNAENGAMPEVALPTTSLEFLPSEDTSVNTTAEVTAQDLSTAQQTQTPAPPAPVALPLDEFHAQDNNAVQPLESYDDEPQAFQAREPNALRQQRQPENALFAEPQPQPQPAQSSNAIPSISDVASQEPVLPKSANVNDSYVAQYLNSAIANNPTPNDDELNGPQATQIIVEKIAPSEVQANQQATVVIKVKNTGVKTIRNLLLHDSIPQNTQFITSDPEVAPSPSGDLYWTNFDLEPQREKKFTYVVKPTQEGDFGSVATVLVPLNAASKTKCSKPELRVVAKAPEKVELGQDVVLEITVSNVGTGSANEVALLEQIPEGLYHPTGDVLNNALNVIKPGEAKQLTLALKCVEPGEHINRLTVSAQNCETQEVDTAIKVVAPELELGIDGPSSVYLERPVMYKLMVKNSGEASAREVRLVAQLPESLAFVKTNNLGAYKENEHCVYWDLADLPANSDGEIELELKSTRADHAELVFSASGPNNIAAEARKDVAIDGIAALSFNVNSSTDLLEVGQDLEYSVQIVNSGTKASTNVILQILAPDAIEIKATDGPTDAKRIDGVIVFDNLAEIKPKSSVTYRVKAHANASGDCRIGFQLSSDDLEPLRKETNTRVYE